MRNFLFVCLLLVAGVVALGFYRGWFSFETTHDPESGRDGVKFDVNRNKITPDIEKARKKLGGSGSEAEDKSQELKQ
jgi:hypothetical protein